ncbi:MAG: ABC transporter permease [Saprospiraceae bacterium]
MPTSQAPASKLTIIRAEDGWFSTSLGELWEHRDLIYFLCWRDIKVRYKQTVLGAAWAVLQPLFTVLVFTLFFGRLAKIPSDNIPYPLFALAGLVPWGFFSNALSQAANSVVNSAGLISKVYFPRLAVPLATVLAGAVDFGVTLLLLAIMMAWYQVSLTWAILLVPVLSLITAVAALGIGLWLAALNVKYRDVRYILPFVTQLWMFATPIVYPSSLLPERWRTFYGINPMAGVVEGFRWCLFHGHDPFPQIVYVSAVIALLFLVTGVMFFRATERSFADLV